MYEKNIRYHLPRTVNEAADLLTSDLMSAHQDTLMSMTDNQFEQLYEVVAAYIIDEFQIWEGNSELLRSCASQSENGNAPFDPARVILKKVRHNLQNTPSMVIIS